MTSQESIANDVRKLLSKGDVVRVSTGVYLKPVTDDPEREVLEIRKMQIGALLSAMSPGRTMSTKEIVDAYSADAMSAMNRYTVIEYLISMTE